LEFQIDGGTVVFSALRRIMAKTIFKDYLSFTGLDEGEIEKWHPVVLCHGVTHFDLFLFPDFFPDHNFCKWNIPHSVSARLLVHA
ncbi:hypothetical protein DFH28DRAFT_910386, partial [Melampsora americana]